MATNPDHDQLVQEFCSTTGATPEHAAQYLEAHGWELLASVNSYYQDEDERTNVGQAQGEPPTASEDAYTGPRTLDGRPAPEAASSRRARAPVQPKKRGIATLGSLGGGSSHQHPDDDDDDEDYDDDDNDDGRGNLFAGGEKSGLAVQDPNSESGGSRKIINDILAKAKANAASADADSEAGPSQPASFRGQGQTLGGDDVESRIIPDPEGPRPSQPSGPLQERFLHIWTDGFSIDDGELRRFDDPANQLDLQLIRSGRAPLHLMNVQHDQPVDVKVHQHGSAYTPQPKKYKPFGGSGHRLGSPVPGDGSASTSSMGAAVSQAASEASSSNPGPAVDDAQPTLTIRVQLPDGTRLPARFNTTHTIGDVYSFVQSASTETRSRQWVLVTTFPNKEHSDHSLVLGEMPEFKKGGTAVVKWT